MFFYPFFDFTMIIVIPGIILAAYAQSKVKSTYSHYSRVLSASRKTGAQVAREILANQGLQDVRVEMIQGHLTDHYDPRDKVVRLSSDVYQNSSLASIGVAAHETGHAIQHSVGYLPLNIRHALVPVANFGSNLAFPLVVLGIILSAPSLLQIGIYLFAAVVLFQLVTLPVEFNASSRALEIISDSGYITSSETKGAKAVLDAAALTYVAALVVGLLNLLRLLMLAGVFRRND